MGRQEQLDQIVRNIWDDELTIYEVAYLEKGRIRFSEDPSCESGIYSFTNSDIQERKAQLQNKPKLCDVPEGTITISQDPNGTWLCWNIEQKYLKAVNCWVYDVEGIEVRCYKLSKGEVIGDWRSTLEEIKVNNNVDVQAHDALTRTGHDATPVYTHRYSDLGNWKLCTLQETQCNTALIKDAFGQVFKVDRCRLQPIEPICIPEDFEDDPDWDGEGLPPVGVGCEMYWGGEYHADVEIIQYRNNGNTVVFWDKGKDRVDAAEMPTTSFRPTKSECDKWLDAVRHHLNTNVISAEIVAIYLGMKDGKIPIPK